MKKSVLATFIIALFSVYNVFSQEISYAKDSFKVSGNCEMCKSKIEKAANSIEGVKSAKWNVGTQKMTIKYNADKTTVSFIQESIAKVGYDTGAYRAKDETYNNLHHCCKYSRD